VALWSNAGSSLRLGRAGGLSRCPAALTGDGRIRVGYDSQCGQAQDWVVAGGTTGDEVVEGPAMRREQTGTVRLTIGGPGRADDVGQFEHARGARLRKAVHQMLDRVDGPAFHRRSVWTWARLGTPHRITARRSADWRLERETGPAAGTTR